MLGEHLGCGRWRRAAAGKASWDLIVKRSACMDLSVAHLDLSRKAAVSAGRTRSGCSRSTPTRLMSSVPPQTLMRPVDPSAPSGPALTRAGPPAEVLDAVLAGLDVEAGLPADHADDAALDADDHRQLVLLEVGFALAEDAQQLAGPADALRQLHLGLVAADLEARRRSSTASRRRAPAGSRRPVLNDAFMFRSTPAHGPGRRRSPRPAGESGGASWPATQSGSKNVTEPIQRLSPSAAATTAPRRAPACRTAPACASRAARGSRRFPTRACPAFCQYSRASWSSSAIRELKPPWAACVADWHHGMKQASKSADCRHSCCFFGTVPTQNALCARRRRGRRRGRGRADRRAPARCRSG